MSYLGKSSNPSQPGTHFGCSNFVLTVPRCAQHCEPFYCTGFSALQLLKACCLKHHRTSGKPWKKPVTNSVYSSKFKCINQLSLGCGRHVRHVCSSCFLFDLMPSPSIPSWEQNVDAVGRSLELTDWAYTENFKRNALNALVGGWATPLKNISQGWLFPQY